MMSYSAADRMAVQAAGSHDPAGQGHETTKNVWTISELAQEFGVSLRTLRFYESKGLLSPRRDGQHRFYSLADSNRLALILKGKRLGFTLSEIRRMIAVEEGEADAHTLRLSREKCIEQIELLERQKTDIEHGLAELRRLHAGLSDKVADFDRTSS
jgi:DNA-binding transcriptional MerR regulator